MKLAHVLRYVVILQTLLLQSALAGHQGFAPFDGSGVSEVSATGRKLLSSLKGPFKATILNNKSLRFLGGSCSKSGEAYLTSNSLDAIFTVQRNQKGLYSLKGRCQAKNPYLVAKSTCEKAIFVGEPIRPVWKITVLKEFNDGSMSVLIQAQKTCGGKGVLGVGKDNKVRFFSKSGTGPNNPSQVWRLRHVADKPPSSPPPQASPSPSRKPPVPSPPKQTSPPPPKAAPSPPPPEPPSPPPSPGNGFAWGENYYGQLGDGNTGLVADVPTSVSTGIVTAWARVAAGKYHTCGIEACTRAGYCWGYNAYGQLGDGNTGTDADVPTAISTGIVTAWAQLSTGQYHTCGIEASTYAGYCWGRNKDGQLGNGNTGTDANVPTAISTGIVTAWAQLSTGQQHTCGIEASTNAGYCWGRNNYGQLGDGNTGTDANVPTAISTGAVTAWAQLAAGFYHTCGIAASNNAGYCWGYNYFGQLGIGNTGTDANVPTIISTGIVTAWSQLTLGFGHTCGIEASTNAGYCWGWNNYGQLGDGNTGTDANVPTAISTGTVTAWSQLTASGGHTCGIEASTNAGYCWGENYYGQLGDGNSGTDASVPTAISTGTVSAWEQLAAGGYSTVGIASVV